MAPDHGSSPSSPPPLGGSRSTPALSAGERWTADALADLRRDRYRAGAWGRFLRSSLARSRESRRDAPAMARQVRAWGAAGAMAWVLACRVGADRRSLPARPAAAGLLWWLAVCRMLGWHLGMAEGHDGGPRARLSAADGLTLLRLWLVPAAPAAARSRVGLPVFIAAGAATDVLDGMLARRAGATRLGRDLDTTADLAFVTAVAASARGAGRVTPIGFWALTVRHALGLAGSLGATFAQARRPAVEGRRWAAVPRVAGLALCSVGARRAGSAAILLGCAVPPRATVRPGS